MTGLEFLKMYVAIRGERLLTDDSLIPLEEKLVCQKYQLVKGVKIQ